MNVIRKFFRNVRKYLTRRDRTFVAQEFPFYRSRTTNPGDQLLFDTDRVRVPRPSYLTVYEPEIVPFHDVIELLESAKDNIRICVTKFERHTVAALLARRRNTDGVIVQVILDRRSICELSVISFLVGSNIEVKYNKNDDESVYSNFVLLDCDSSRAYHNTQFKNAPRGIVATCQLTWGTGAEDLSFEQVTISSDSREINIKENEWRSKWQSRSFETAVNVRTYEPPRTSRRYRGLEGRPGHAGPSGNRRSMRQRRSPSPRSSGMS